jgi:hypothetical protein
MDELLTRLTDLRINDNNSQLISDVIDGLTEGKIRLADVMQSLG